MKTLIIGGIAAVGGFLVWRMLNSAQTGTTSHVPSAGQGTFSNQPSASYPFIANQPPRVDNSNQPWYGGDRSGLMGGNPQMTGLSGTAADAKSVQSIVSSASSIWNDLGISDWLNSAQPSDASVN